MKAASKNDDCYFYYYSTCAKGDKCPFRHEASALGNETVCTFWQQGNCSKLHCMFRHMELKKNRSLIPCFWESQPSGCKKPHCPFLHNNRKEIDEDSKKTAQNADLETEANGGNEGSIGSSPSPPTVQPVVVDMNEESDSESIPTPCKPSGRDADSCVQVKSLEELRLEQIQKQDAALYNYQDTFSDVTKTHSKSRMDLRNRLGRFPESKNHQRAEHDSDCQKANSVFKVKTLDEIRAAKMAKGRGSDDSPAEKNSDIRESSQEKASNIKTIEEIRAVKMARQKMGAESHEKASSVKAIEEIRAEKLLSKQIFGEESHEKVTVVKSTQAIDSDGMTKIKTIEEIRADKLAKSSPKESAPDILASSDVSATSNNKRSAPLGRQLRIKRAKLETQSEDISKTPVISSSTEVTAPSRTKSTSEGEVEMGESPAPSIGRQIRIKRLRTNSAPVPVAPEDAPVIKPVQTKSAEPVAPVTAAPTTAPSANVVMAPTPSSTVDDSLADDFLEEDEDVGMDDGEATNGGSLNDDELLLEIDNILGD